MKVKRVEEKGTEELITQRVQVYSVMLEGRRLQRGRIRKNSYSRAINEFIHDQRMRE